MYNCCNNNNEVVKVQTFLIKESEKCISLLYKNTNQHIGLAKISLKKKPTIVFSNTESGYENMSE